jgi:hypothetical protein
LGIFLGKFLKKIKVLQFSARLLQKGGKENYPKNKVKKFQIGYS